MKKHGFIKNLCFFHSKLYVTLYVFYFIFYFSPTFFLVFPRFFPNFKGYQISLFFLIFSTF